MSTWITVTGWTLLHFVWQGTLIALAVGAAMRLLRHRSSHVRYTVACAGLALMLLAPLLTAGGLMNAVNPLATIVSPAASAGEAQADLKVRLYAPNNEGGDRRGGSLDPPAALTR